MSIQKATNQLIKAVKWQNERVAQMANLGDPYEPNVVNNQQAIDAKTTALVGELIMADVYSLPAVAKPVEPEPNTREPLPIDTERVQGGGKVNGTTMHRCIILTSVRPGDYFDVHLPAGRVKGCSIGALNWGDLDRTLPFWGDQTIRIIGHPDGTTITEASQYTIAAQNHPGWCGKVHYCNLDIETSPRNLFNGNVYGNMKFEPIEVRFIDCNLIEGERDCLRPISLNQASVALVRGTAKLPGADEHLIYSRGVHKHIIIHEHELDGVGAQWIQAVSRRSEGPQLDRGNIYLYDSQAHDYGRTPGRSGSAVTLAGSNCNLHMDNVTMTDKDGSSHGAIVAYDGDGKSYLLPSGKTNGHIKINDLTVDQSDMDRSVAKFEDQESLVVTDSGWWAPNREIRIVGDNIHWSGNKGNIPVRVNGVDYAITQEVTV